MTTQTTPSPSASQAKAADQALRQDVLPFQRKDIRKIEVVDTDFVVTLADGKKVVIRDGALKAMMYPDYQVKLNDLAFNGQMIIQNAGSFDFESVAKLTGRSANVAEPEPAKPEFNASKPNLQSLEPAQSGTSQPQVGLVAKAEAPVAKPAAPVNPEGAVDKPAAAAATAEGKAAQAETTAAVKPSEPVGLGGTGAAEASTGGFFAGINPAWGALGALGALGAGGGGGGGDAVAASSGDPTYVLLPPAADTSVLFRTVLNVVLGEVNGDLNYIIKSSAGDVLAQGTLPAASGGELIVDFKTDYVGPVEVTISDPNRSDDKGYVDETTGKGTSLTADLRAVVMLNAEDVDQVKTINVTPLTELAVRWLYSSNGGKQTFQTLTADAMAQAYEKVALAMGLKLSTGEPMNLVEQTGLKALNDGNESPSAEALAYAQVLAALSGYDSTSKGSMSNTLAELTTAIVSLPTGVITNSRVGKVLIEGVAAAMESMVKQELMQADQASAVINQVWSSASSPSTLNLSSVLFDGDQDWIVKGDNQFILNFNRTVDLNTILSTLMIDGQSAAAYGITANDLVNAVNKTTPSRQWILTLDSQLQNVATDADGRLTLSFNNSVMETGLSTPLTVEIGSVDPVMTESGMIGLGGNSPSYQIKANLGLAEVKALITGPGGIFNVTLSPVAGSNIYRYTFADTQALSAGAYTAQITLVDKFGNEVVTTGNGFVTVAQPTYQLSAETNSGWVTGYDEASGTYTYNPGSISKADFTTSYKTFTYIINAIEGAEVLVTWNDAITIKATEDPNAPGVYRLQFTVTADGQYAPKIQIRDAASNETTYKTYYGPAVLVDSTPLALKDELGTVAENTAGDTALRVINLPMTENNVTTAPQAVKFWGRLGGPDGALFELLPNGTQLRFLGTTDFESRSEYRVSLTASDEAGNLLTKEFVIKVSNVNEAPVVTQAISFSTTEDVGTQTLDLTQHVTDVDALVAANGESLTVTLDTSQTPQGLFTLDADGKTLRINTGHASLQHLAEGQRQSYTLNYQVKDSRGLSVNQSATIQITGKNDRPTVDTAALARLPSLHLPIDGVQAPPFIPSILLLDVIKDLVADADDNAKLGVAITGVFVGEQLNSPLFMVSQDGGVNWTDWVDNEVRAIGESNALLLNVTAQTRIALIPSIAYSLATTFEKALRFKAWDQTDGRASGSFADTTQLTSVSLDSYTLPWATEPYFTNATTTTFLTDDLSPTQLLGGNQTVVVADFNGDGVLDVYAPTVGVAQADWMYWGSAGSPRSFVGDPNAVSAGNVAGMVQSNGLFVDQNTIRPTALDYNNDGRMDLLMTSGYANVSLLDNTTEGFVNVGWASGLAKQRSNSDTGNGKERVALADFNGDGFVDVVVSSGTPGRLSILQNNGDGTFGFDNAWNLSSPVNSSAMGPILWGDFTGDGILDLMSISNNTSTNGWATILSTGTSTGFNSSSSKNYQLGAGALNQLIRFDQFGLTSTTLNDLSNLKLVTNFASAVDYDQDGRLDLLLGAGTINGVAFNGMLLHNNPGSGLTSDGRNVDWIFERVEAIETDPTDGFQGQVRAATWLNFGVGSQESTLVTVEELANGRHEIFYYNYFSGQPPQFDRPELHADMGWDLPTNAQVTGLNAVDLDQDGRLDFLIHTDQGTQVLYNDGVLLERTTSLLKLNVLGAVGDTPLYGAKVTLLKGDQVLSIQYVQGDTGEGLNQGSVIFSASQDEAPYTIQIEYAFDSDRRVNGMAVVDPNAQTPMYYDTGINLEKVVLTYNGLTPSAQAIDIRVDPSDVNHNNNLAQALRFSWWNPSIDPLNDDQLKIFRGTSGADTFEVDPEGARVYLAGAGNDTLTFRNDTRSVSVSLLARDATGVTGSMGFQYHPSQDAYYSATPFWLGGNRETGDPVATSTEIRTGGVNFTGIDRLVLTGGNDIVLDSVGMSNIAFGAGNDKLFMAADAVFNSTSGTLVYDGGEGNSDEVDFRNLTTEAMGTTRMRFKWSLNDQGLEQIAAYLSTQQAPIATFVNFEKITGTEFNDIYDYRLMNRAYTNIVVSGSDDTWYGTIASALNTDGDYFNIDASSKGTLNAKMFSGGIDETYGGLGVNNEAAAGGDRLYIRMPNAQWTIKYTGLTTGIDLKATGNSVNDVWFTGTMNDADEMYLSRYKSVDLDFNAMRHGVKINVHSQTSSLTDITGVTSAKFVLTEFDDVMSVGSSDFGTGSERWEGRGGNDEVNLRVGTRADAVNGTTTLVYGKYNPADRLYGNGTDTVTGFLTNLDQARTVGEDVLDLSGFGLHNTITQANLNRYLSFKTSPITGSTVTVSLMFDHTGQGAFDLGGDTTTLVKLNAMSNTLTWNDASLWNLIQAGQVVL